MSKTKELSNFKTNKIMHELLIALNKKGKSVHGMINEQANAYNVNRKTITRIWTSIKQQEVGTVINVNNKKKVTHNSKIKFDEPKFKALEKTKKTIQLAVAKAMGVSQSTVFRWKKKKLIRKHTDAIKPHLTVNYKVDRLTYSLSSYTSGSMTNTFKFTDMSNVVHIDEKLFYITKEQKTYYLSPGKIAPHRDSV